MNLYFDTEFTGLHQETTLISIGIVSDCGKTFYAELTDYDKSQVNEWLDKNVIQSLMLSAWEDGTVVAMGDSATIKGDRKEVSDCLKEWLSQFDDVDMWSDLLDYDWMLFNKLIAEYKDGYPSLPENINYIPFDISTLMKIKGIDPDIGREEFAGVVELCDIPPLHTPLLGKKHNALFDAVAIKKCYLKLTQEHHFDYAAFDDDITEKYL